MRIKTKFLFAADLLYKRKWQYVLSIIMLIVSLVLFDISFTTRENETGLTERFLSACQKEPERLYQINWSNISEQLLEHPEKLAEMLKTYETDMQPFLPAGFCYSGTVFKELWKNEDYLNAQAKKQVTEEEMLSERAGHSQVLYLSENAVKLWELRDTKKNQIDLTPEGDALPLYVGQGYAALFTIGDQLTDAKGKTYVIKGFLAPNASWPAGNAMGLAAIRLQNLDYTFVTGLSNAAMALNNMYFYIDKGDELLAFETLKKLEKQYPVTISAGSVFNMVDSIRAELKDYVGMFETLTIVLLLLGLLTFTASSLIMLLVQKKKIGIWYANGFLPKDVRGIVMIPQIFRIVLALPVVLTIGSVMSFTYREESYRVIHLTKTVPVLFGLSGIMLFAAVVMPLLYLRSLKIVDLIKGDPL